MVSKEPCTVVKGTGKRHLVLYANHSVSSSGVLLVKMTDLWTIVVVWLYTQHTMSNTSSTGQISLLLSLSLSCYLSMLSLSHYALSLSSSLSFALSLALSHTVEILGGSRLVLMDDVVYMMTRWTHRGVLQYASAI
jgi:hypothetical protein